MKQNLDKLWRKESHKILCQKMDYFDDPVNAKYTDFLILNLHKDEILGLIIYQIYLAEAKATDRVRRDEVDRIKGWR